MRGIENHASGLEQANRLLRLLRQTCLADTGAWPDEYADHLLRSAARHLARQTEKGDRRP